MKPTFLSLFCGIGGGALGFKRAGFDCVGAIDVDPAVIRTQLAGSCEWHEFTSEHSLQRRRIRNGTKRRYLADPEFVPAAELRKGDRLGILVEPEKIGCAREWVAAFGDPTMVPRRDGTWRRHGRVVDLREKAESTDLWFLLGVYLADGYRRHDRTEINFCVGPADGDEAMQVRAARNGTGLRLTVDEVQGLARDGAVQRCAKNDDEACFECGKTCERSRRRPANYCCNCADELFGSALNEPCEACR